MNHVNDAEMKLIKAFIRPGRTAEVLRALQHAGAPGISVSRAHGVGFGYDPQMFISSAAGEVSGAPDVARIEVVCHDDEVGSLIETIVRSGNTGSPGDGIVFVMPVERTVRIRTGEERLGRLHRIGSNQRRKP